MTPKLISKQIKKNICDIDQTNSNLKIIGAQYQQLEIQVLRKIYGAVHNEEGWRIRNNDEFEKLIRGEDIIKCTEDKMVVTS
jgi:hypothetical protein